ncbi:MAG: hypothetical protein E7633_07180 [Ruminococcaceae bacterium]|nr:hypothetical protein [Oscillospiraceae bacterium]
MDKNNYRYLRENMQSEAVYALTHKPVETYSSERVRLWSEICEEVKDITNQPLKLGTALKSFLSRVSVPVSENDILIGRMVEESFTEEEEKIFREKYITPLMRNEGIPKFLFDAGHQSFLWKDTVDKGLPALKAEAEEYLKKYTDEGCTEKCNFLRGAIMIYESIICFINRCADAAEEKGLSESAKACREAASGAPKTLHSALQLVWAIEFIFCAYLSPNPTLALGRLDLFLNGIYEKELASGSIDRDTASLLIDEFYAKNNLIMGRGEHQISSRENSPNCTGWHRILCYDAPQYLILAGTEPDTKEAVCNGLTEIMVERINPKYKNPVIVFRYTKDFAEKHSDVWKTLVSKMRASGSIMIYNDISVCEMYKSFGESEYDALSHEYYGCNWPTIPAKDAPNYNVFFYGVERCLIPTLMDAVRASFENEREFSRERMLQSVYDTFFSKFSELIAKNTRNEPFFDPNQLRFCSCFAFENISRGGTYFQNINLIVPFGGIGTMIDIVSAMDYLVSEKNISAERIFTACDSNFDNDPVLLAMCKNAPKMGDGHETSSYYAKELTRTIINACKNASKDRPSFLKLRFCTENDTWHIQRGDIIPATPDGRRIGDPITQNCQPSVGAAKNGITAMLSSISNIPFDQFASGALNITIQPKNFEGDTGLENLSHILAVYFEKGGLQVQLSSVDKELLLDAQKNPDMYRDLMVRVTGYSAVFVDMCKKAQDDLISRNTF